MKKRKSGLKIVKGCGGRKRGCGSHRVSTWEDMTAKTFERKAA